MQSRREALALALAGALAPSVVQADPLSGDVASAAPEAAYWQEPAPPTPALELRIVNDHQIVTFYYCPLGGDWVRHGVRSEVSGYNANTVDDLLSLRPALFVAGSGDVSFRNYRYRAL